VIAQRQFLIPSSGIHFRSLQLEADRGSVVLNRARAFPRLGVVIAARPVSLRVARLQAHRPFQVRQRPHRIAAGQIVSTSRAQCRGVAGIFFERFRIFPDGLFAAPRLVGPLPTLVRGLRFSLVGFRRGVERRKRRSQQCERQPQVREARLSISHHVKN